MVYTILISIVFIAEVIIAITIIQALLRLDNIIISTDETFSEANVGIREIVNLFYKISGQLVEISERFVYKFKKNQEEVALKYLSKILIALLLLKVNIKAINSFRKSRIGKVFAKGLSILENMV